MLADLFVFVHDHWFLIVPSALVVCLLYNKYHGGLSKYPGPALAAYTNYWRFFNALGRQTEKTTIALHRDHGDIVRLGPNVLSFSDPKAIKEIYGLNKGFTKVLNFARQY
jgi:hypothetical protein